ncbi:MAG TPA: glycosyltransferase [Pyrinomonadaceae bacterium]|jgi:glycosyltransferase involved in cell wall biosynthesis
MITGQNIIFISSIEWDFLWQGHQEIAIRFARAGNRILYVENMGVRSPGLKDAARVLTRFKRWGKSLRTGGVREVAPNIYVCSPLIMPPFASALHRTLNRRLFLPLIRRTARKLGIEDAMLWTYLPTDTAFDLINILRTRSSTVVYYCIADFAHLTPHTEKLLESERSIVETSDIVFAQGPELAERCGRWNSSVHIFPFGVNLDAFPLDPPGNDTAGAHGSNNSHALSALPQLPRPVIGYIGGMHKHVDFRMLTELARMRPEWSWVFVGALQTDVGNLSTLPNVHLLGQQPHYELARYIHTFDVCIVPYVESAFTATVVPTKINEYLAAGKPVVSTSIPAVVEFNRRHNALLTAVAQSDKFLEAIERALRLPNDASARLKRREVATLGSWDTRLEAMSELIEMEMKAKADDGRQSVQKARVSA